MRDHILETIRGAEHELDERRLKASVERDRIGGLRVAALLHDIAKPLTRGEYDGRIIFVAHDTLGARMAHAICRRLELPASITDLAITLTALHLKIGFMGNPRSDYPPERLIETVGPFGEELAVLCWADRLAAQGPRLKSEHVERHRELCVEFLQAYRAVDHQPAPDYEALAGRLDLETSADAGYAASRMRALQAKGLGEEDAVRCVRELAPGGSARTAS